MNDVSLVVEGVADVALLRGLLRSEADTRFRFFAAGGRISLESLGRNILFHEGNPLMIVMDADTLDLEKAEASCRMTESLLKNISPDGRFDVFAFVPELEVVFFESPSVLRRMFAEEVVSRAVIERGIDEPKATLEGILKAQGLSKRMTILERLSGEDFQELRRGEQAERFVKAVEELAATLVS